MSIEAPSRKTKTTLTGLEFVSGLADGTIEPPPMAQTLPFILLQPTEGEVALEATPEERFYNPMRIVHGGWTMMLLDTVLGLAAQTTLAAGELCPTHETSVKFVRPITVATGPLTVIGKVVSRGRKVITTEARMMDAAGRLFAHGSASLLIVAADRP